MRGLMECRINEQHYKFEQADKGEITESFDGEPRYRERAYEHHYKKQNCDGDGDGHVLQVALALGCNCHFRNFFLPLPVLPLHTNNATLRSLERCCTSSR